MRMFLLGVVITLCIVNPVITKKAFSFIVDGIHNVYETAVNKLTHTCKS